MLTVLNRIFVTSFYVQNAGTFLVVFLLAFGFLRANEHEALITAAIGNPFLLAIVFGLWTLYLLKTIAFVGQQLAAPEHLFIRTFWLIPSPKRWAMWFVIQISLLMPIIGYGGWMIKIAASYQQWLALVAILLFIGILVFVGALFANYRLKHPGSESIRLFRLSVQLPYELFFPTYWLRHEPLSLVLTKAFSGLILAGVCRLYPTDDYDERLLLIGLLLAVLAHSQVGGQISHFERRYLLLLPNMPFSGLQRLGRYALTFAVIWLPELLILLRNCPADIRLDYVAWLWLTGWGWILLMHSLAYGYEVLPERWLSGVVAGFVIGLIIIMFGLPAMAWLLIGWIGAVAVWLRSQRKVGTHY
ncbi:hypothetical protein WBJ53_13010 [Spirosoma sp. SC4-14]|uniref:hypothetical protein n=1 Tax=Spirosoma sp. SC4-14 TaxID=3128900 RepID=UPI0030CD3F4F